MYIQTLKNILIVRRLRRADCARMCHVSRAAVSRWFYVAEGQANIETRTLINLARGLEVDPAELLLERKNISHLQTMFLWDRLYPSMEEFLLAIVEGRMPATARFVQVLGLSVASKIIGRKAVRLFPRYKKYIKPVRRQQMEIIWPLYLSKN